MRLLALSSILLFLAPAAYAQQGGLYPPGLLPLINRANALLSTGQFNEAAKIYSEAIDQSPSDYLLFYKRATAYFSLQRHTSALDDFEKVLSLTSNTFDNAHLMKSRIYIRDGHFSLARESLTAFLKSPAGKAGTEAEELDREIKEGERLVEKTEKERRAQLWNACVESASQALRIASHSVVVMNWRAECALAAGDVESAVGDLTRLTHLLPPSTTLLTHIFRLSYFLLPPSPGPLNTLKQCLHYDPDSKPCLILHRMLKKFDKGFIALDEFLGKEDWRGAMKYLTKSSAGNVAGFWRRYEEALGENMGAEMVLPLLPHSLLEDHEHGKQGKGKGKKMQAISLPLYTKKSPQRQYLVRSLCRSYTHLAGQSPSLEEYRVQTAKWCEELLSLEECHEDIDGLVGRSEGLLFKEEWDEAVRVLEKAFEQGGRQDRWVHEKLQSAQRKAKQARQKDYYKILGVPRDIDQRSIKKAFRKQAKLAHPDKGGSEAKMAALNEAYEVLSNPELRERFDRGEDPMDPMAGQGGHPFAQGQHPFAQFFQQQGGGFGQGNGGRGFQFHFSHGH
ncbi:hypothetical protein K443DRAFT_91478 [Laccaria amethystina LaAM-08-1]|uniref:J domain-containing protein n=1 Tax=Laccaria amethystina LaAM-08-1 TaxID=1095629 RepID=A0A0C9YB88_9AGAR|nr:hypothetical protein K443DRAFT_91478 [Laccaria amethystina LaAM-08-1]